MLGILVSSYGVYANRDMIRNWSAILGLIAEETAKSLRAQKWSLNSLAQVVLDNWLVLDFLLAKQGRVCAVLNTTCCVYVNTSGDAVT